MDGAEERANRDLSCGQSAPIRSPHPSKAWTGHPSRVEVYVMGWALPKGDFAGRHSAHLRPTGHALAGQLQTRLHVGLVCRAGAWLRNNAARHVNRSSIESPDFRFDGVLVLAPAMPEPWWQKPEWLTGIATAALVFVGLLGYLHKRREKAASDLQSRRSCPQRYRCGFQGERLHRLLTHFERQRDVGGSVRRPVHWFEGTPWHREVSFSRPPYTTVGVFGSCRETQGALVAPKSSVSPQNTRF